MHTHKETDTEKYLKNGKIAVLLTSLLNYKLQQTSFEVKSCSRLLTETTLPLNKIEA